MARSSLPPFEEYCAEIRDMWDSRWLTNMGEKHEKLREGKQLYSYAHVADAVSGMLWVLLFGDKGEAYNLADEESDVTLKDLAQIAADSAGTKVVFDLPDKIERLGFSKAQKAVLEASKLKELGWNATYSIRDALIKTVDIMIEE